MITLTYTFDTEAALLAHLTKAAAPATKPETPKADPKPAKTETKTPTPSPAPPPAEVKAAEPETVVPPAADSKPDGPDEKAYQATQLGPKIAKAVGPKSEGRAAVVALLAKYGVTKGPLLKTSMFQVFEDELDALIASQAGSLG